MTESPVEEAMRVVDRRGFLPEGLRGRADEDGPLPIGGGQTNSQPRTVRNMLDLLEVAEGMTVLDVGAGSGWTTALLAHLVGSAGRVIGVEIDPHLAAWGAENLASRGAPWAEIHPAEPGVLGWPATGPYDRILVSADAPSVPQALVDQLADDGVMVLPVNDVMLRVRRGRRGDAVTTEHGLYRFVPLRESLEPRPRWPRRRRH
jgi:protein-L-isoaspartate(D-aspartate) O-methyltransferase